MVPSLPDALSVGPLSIPTFPLFLLLGAYAFITLAAHRARRSGLEPVWLERMAFWAVAGALAGAKFTEIVRSPAGFLESPRLLLSMPIGPVALSGAIAGTIVAIAIVHRGKRQALGPSLDALAVPALLGLAVASLGGGDTRALPLAVAWSLAALLLHWLEPQSRFAGHGFLGGLVLGGMAFVLGDFFRPLANGLAGISTDQLVAAGIAIVAWVAAVVYGPTGVHHGGEPGHTTKSENDEGE